MLNAIGQRQTELALQLGTLFTADQALSIGLVDKVVEDRAECLAEAHKMVTTIMCYIFFLRGSEIFLGEQDDSDPCRGEARQ